MPRLALSKGVIADERLIARLPLTAFPYPDVVVTKSKIVVLNPRAHWSFLDFPSQLSTSDLPWPARANHHAPPRPDRSQIRSRS